MDMTKMSHPVIIKSTKYEYTNHVQPCWYENNTTNTINLDNVLDINNATCSNDTDSGLCAQNTCNPS